MKRSFVRMKAETVSLPHRLGAALLALCFCLLFSLPVVAEKTAARLPADGVDLQRMGSVLIEVKDGGGNPVSGGTLQLYCAARLAAADAGLSFVFTDAFSAWNGSVDDLYTDASCAEALSAFAIERGVESLASAEISNGSASFGQLLPGAYLVVQTAAAEGYETMLPFLLFLPQVTDGAPVYDVTAQSKPVDLLPPGETTLVAEKQVAVRSGAAPGNTVFSFVLTALTPDAPLPENSNAVYNAADRSVTVSRTGAGDVFFGRLTFSEPDVGRTYEYSVREAQGSAAHYTYDTAVYRATVRVTRAEDGKKMQVSTVLTDASGNEVSDIVFRNLYDGDDTPEIPRTGQLWWPVLLMFPVGLLLAVLGVVFLRRGEKEEDRI